MKRSNKSGFPNQRSFVVGRTATLAADGSMISSDPVSIEPQPEGNPLVHGPALPSMPSPGDYSAMSCDQLAAKIAENEQLIITSKLGPDVIQGFNNEMVAMRTAYDQKGCSLKSGSPVLTGPPIQAPVAKARTFLEKYRWGILAGTVLTAMLIYSSKRSS